MNYKFEIQKICTFSPISMHEMPSSPAIVTTIFYCSHTVAADYLTSSTKMLHAKYKRTSPADVVHTCDHLTDINRPDLLALSFKFPHMFSGKLGCYVYNKFSVNLKDPKTPPMFYNPYHIPLVHQ